MILDWSSVFQCFLIYALFHVATVGCAVCVVCDSVCLLASVADFRKSICDDRPILEMVLNRLKHLEEGVCMCVCVVHVQLYADMPVCMYVAE